MLVPGLRGFRASLAILEMQFEPVGSVAGIAAFVPGYLRVTCRGWSGDTSPVIHNAAEGFYNQLWTTAVDRLRDQAHKLGADGVVGVSTTQSSLDVGWQLQLSGTAFRLSGSARLAAPFLSTLPMADFLTLLAAGWIPTGIAWGHAAIHVHGPATSPSWQGVTWQNAEMPEPTDAVNLARTHAEAAARTTMRGSRGAVGMTIDVQRQSQGCWNSRTPGMLVLAHAVGTGVVQYRERALQIRPTQRLSVEVAQ